MQYGEEISGNVTMLQLKYARTIEGTVSKLYCMVHSWLVL